MSVWKGPREFAKDLKAEFDAAKPGGLMKAKLIEAVVKMLIAHSARPTHDGFDLSKATEEELAAAFAALTGEKNGSGRPTTNPAKD